MDRQMVYPGEIPLDTDFLQIQQNAMIGQGWISQFMLGSSPCMVGLACIPTTPASMQVIVQAGAMSAVMPLENTAFGSLPADVADTLLKIGINKSNTTLPSVGTFATPGTSGQSINYLIQAQVQENDVNAVVLPYYNAANPAQPFLGPNNNGVAQNTTRQQTVALQIKAGAAAATGSQVTPGADAGWTGLYSVQVNFGDTSIGSGRITALSGAPTRPLTLPQIPTLIRTTLTAPLTLYVSPSGNDSNNGLTAATPFLTIQKAWNTLMTAYDLDGNQATIQLANGTYTAGLNTVGMPLGSASTAVNLIGNNGSPGSCVISVTNAPGILTQLGTLLSVQGIQVQATGTSGAYFAAGIGFYCGAGAQLVFNNVIFGTCGTGHMATVGGGSVSINGNGATYTIAGSAPYHMEAVLGGIVTIVNGTVTISGSPVFSSAFAIASACGSIQAYGATFTGGSATGPRYLVNTNGVILTNGAGANFFPGNSAGATSTGGQYT